MIIIDDVLVSDEIKDIYFSCNLKACRGDCCVEGDAGAPLEEEEISVLEDYLDEITPYMTKEGIEAVKLTGVFDYDMDAEYVTTLVNNVSQVGQFYVKWDGDDKFGKMLPSGIYFVQLKTDTGIIKNKKMMFLK
jgi:hypothetical protein